jgi:hypothetical protein
MVILTNVAAPFYRRISQKVNNKDCVFFIFVGSHPSSVAADAPAE